MKRALNSFISFLTVKGSKLVDERRADGVHARLDMGIIGATRRSVRNVRRLPAKTIVLTLPPKNVSQG